MSSQSTSIPQYFQTMSAVPPRPTPSNPPPSLDSTEPSSSTATHPTSSSKHSRFPTPKLRLELRDLLHDSTDVFLQNFRSSKDFSHLVSTVLRLLYIVDDHNNEPNAPQQPTPVSRPAPSKPSIPDTRSVTLIVRDMGGVAYTTGTELDDDHKEIHLSLDYISHAARGQSSTRHELLGVIAHELVHCFQWNGKGSAPGGLIEGIADWVRLNAGFVPPHWKKDANGDWDRGYQNTGYFLDWIEKTKGKGSIYRLNQALCDKKYDESKFWPQLFGEKVQDLYSHYKTSLEKEAEESKAASENHSEKFSDASKMEIRVRVAGNDSIDESHAQEEK